MCKLQYLCHLFEAEFAATLYGHLFLNAASLYYCTTLRGVSPPISDQTELPLNVGMHMVRAVELMSTVVECSSIGGHFGRPSNVALLAQYPPREVERTTPRDMCRIGKNMEQVFGVAHLRHEVSFSSQSRCFEALDRLGRAKKAGTAGRRGRGSEGRLDRQGDTVPVSRLDKRREKKNMKASADVFHESSVPRKSNTTLVLYCTVADLGWVNMVCNGPP